MKRIATLIGILAIVAAACSSGSAGAPGAPATDVITPPPVTEAPPTPTPTADSSSSAGPILVSVTFDGSTCRYAGPAVFPEGSYVTFSFKNVDAALADETMQATLEIVPVDEGVTWDEFVEAARTGSYSHPPSWLSGMGWTIDPPSGERDTRLATMDWLLAHPEDVVGPYGYMRSGSEWMVGCGVTATDTMHPGALLYVITD